MCNQIRVVRGEKENKETAPGGGGQESDTSPRGTSLRVFIGKRKGGKADSRIGKRECQGGFFGNPILGRLAPAALGLTTIMCGNTKGRRPFSCRSSRTIRNYHSDGEGGGENV